MPLFPRSGMEDLAISLLVLHTLPSDKKIKIIPIVALKSLACNSAPPHPELLIDLHRIIVQYRTPPRQDIGHSRQETPSIPRYADSGLLVFGPLLYTNSAVGSSSRYFLSIYLLNDFSQHRQAVVGESIRLLRPHRSVCRSKSYLTFCQ